MPIRFRCPYCDQLMGIARRKAGTTVSCTACQSQVVVPAEDESAPAPMTAPAIGPSPSPIPGPAPRDVFDRDDFDVILQREPVRAPPVATPPPPVRAPRPDDSLMMPAQAAPANGVVLSPGWATILTVVLVLLLALAFVAGVLVGRFAL